MYRVLSDAHYHTTTPPPTLAGRVVKAVVKESLPMPVSGGDGVSAFCFQSIYLYLCLESPPQVRIAVNEVEKAMEKSEIKVPFLSDEEGKERKDSKKKENETNK